MNRLAQPLGALLDGPDADTDGGAGFGDWQPLLDAWRRSPAGVATIAAVDQRVAAGAPAYPAQVFRAFALTPLARTKVLILGQDPYHGPGQADGLAFSVPAGQRIPPSLRNIFAELHRDLGLARPAAGSLLAWAQRGVLLLNTALTVEDALPAAHAKLGWQVLTDAVCVALAADAAPKVYMLWGAQAQAKAPLLARQAADARASRTGGGAHLVLQCNHPSPLSASRPPQPFVGCGHFGRANHFLSATGRGPVDWSLT